MPGRRYPRRLSAGGHLTGCCRSQPARWPALPAHSGQCQSPDVASGASSRASGMGRSGRHQGQRHGRGRCCSRLRLRLWAHGRETESQCSRHRHWCELAALLERQTQRRHRSCPNLLQGQCHRWTPTARRPRGWRGPAPSAAGARRVPRQKESLQAHQRPRQSSQSSWKRGTAGKKTGNERRRRKYRGDEVKWLGLHDAAADRKKEAAIRSAVRWSATQRFTASQRYGLSAPDPSSLHVSPSCSSGAGVGRCASRGRRSSSRCLRKRDILTQILARRIQPQSFRRSAGSRCADRRRT